MGLITKEVEIKTNACNCKYYENLGYKLPHKPNGKIDMGKSFKMVKPEIPLTLGGGMNGIRGNYDKLLEKQKSSQISITISPDFCL